MAGDYVVGAVGTVRVAITAVDDTATPPTAGVRLLDNNDQPITPQAVIPQTLITVQTPSVTVNDVLEHIETQRTVIVRWIDPANPRRWSESPLGVPAHDSTVGVRALTACAP